MKEQGVCKGVSAAVAPESFVLRPSSFSADVGFVLRRSVGCRFSSELEDGLHGVLRLLRACLYRGQRSRESTFLGFKI